MKTLHIVNGIVVLIVIMMLTFILKNNEVSVEKLTTSKVICQPTMSNCLSPIGDGKLQWSVEQSIQYLKPFMNKIELTNIQVRDVQQISIEFVMQGMQMAVNRSIFKRQASGLWQAQSVLPICVSGRKDWQAIIRVETHQSVWQTEFQFQLPAK